MTARHRRPPAPRRRVAAWNAAANRIPEVARWGLGAAAVALAVAGTVGAAHSVAPQVAAVERDALPVEPVAHGGLGGPLVIPSIGALPGGAETSTVTPEPPPSFVRDVTTSHARPGSSPRTVGDRAPTVTTGLGIATTAPTTTPPATQAATTTEPTTAAATTTEPTTEPLPTLTEVLTTEEA